MKHLEIKSIIHKNVRVTVKIDYIGKAVSLVETQDNSTPTVYKPKDWRFHNRGIEYMDGWLHIFEAMAVAVKQAKKDLQEHIDAEEKQKEELVIMLSKEDLKKKK